MFMSINVYGWFVLNASCSVFDPNPCDDGGLKSMSSSSLGSLIVEGAGYFLKSNANYQLFLEKVELSGSGIIDRDALLALLDEAVSNMEAANDTYYQMIQAANALQYDSAVLDKLKNFAYDRYRLENRLNPSVFAQVVLLLKAGDVRGCYSYFYKKTIDILARIKALKVQVETGSFPDIPTCWRLNQVYQETGLFGQYTAEVFYALN
jgi:hypothetical protein